MRAEEAIPSWAWVAGARPELRCRYKCPASTIVSMSARERVEEVVYEDAEYFLEFGERMPENVDGVSEEVRAEWNALVEACERAGLSVQARLDDDLNPKVLGWIRELVEDGRIPGALRRSAEVGPGWSRVVDVWIIEKHADVSLAFVAEVWNDGRPVVDVYKSVYCEEYATQYDPFLSLRLRS